MARIDDEARVAFRANPFGRIEDALGTVAGHRVFAHGRGHDRSGAEISGFMTPVAVGPAELK